MDPKALSQRILYYIDHPEKPLVKARDLRTALFSLSEEEMFQALEPIRDRIEKFAQDEAQPIFSHRTILPISRHIQCLEKLDPTWSHLPPKVRQTFEKTLISHFPTATLAGSNLGSNRVSADMWRSILSYPPLAKATYSEQELCRALDVFSYPVRPLSTALFLTPSNVLRAINRIGRCISPQSFQQNPGSLADRLVLPHDQVPQDPDLARTLWRDVPWAAPLIYLATPASDYTGLKSSKRRLDILSPEILSICLANLGTAPEFVSLVLAYLSPRHLYPMSPAHKATIMASAPQAIKTRIFRNLSNTPPNSTYARL